jgi:hypothetical protein
MSDSKPVALVISVFVIIVYLVWFHDWGLNSKSLLAYEKTETLLSQSSSSFQNSLSEFKSIKSDWDYSSVYKEYDRKEGWTALMENVSGQLEALSLEFNTKLKDTYKHNSSKHNSFMIKNTKKIRRLIVSLSKKYKGVLDRIKKIQEVERKSGQFLETGEQNADKIENFSRDVITKLKKYTTEYPHQKKELIDMAIPFQTAIDISLALSRELDYNSKDYLLILDNTTRLSDDLKDIIKKGEGVDVLLGDLDQNVMIRLLRKNHRNLVKIFRESWDSDEDGGTHEHTYKWKNSSDSCYSYYKGRVGAKLGTGRIGGWASFSTANQSCWDALGIDLSESRGWGDDRGDFYVEEVAQRFFISTETTITLKTGVTNTTRSTQEEVDGKLYHSLEGFTNKIIEHKPRGQFKRETKFFYPR